MPKSKSHEKPQTYKSDASEITQQPAYRRLTAPLASLAFPRERVGAYLNMKCPRRRIEPGRGALRWRGFRAVIPPAVYLGIEAVFKVVRQRLKHLFLDRFR